MKVWLILAALVVIALAAVGLTFGDRLLGDAPLIAGAKKSAAAELRDPSSAQFRNVRVDGMHVCGEINGKNGFGAYTGFVRFHGDKSSAQVDPGDGGPTLYGEPVMKTTFESSWRIYCGAAG